jgi:hypothetical protein
MSRVTDFAEKLQGTCNSLGDEMVDWTDAELEEFDNLVFECEVCGWWCETSEMAPDENVIMCEGCYIGDQC